MIDFNKILTNSANDFEKRVKDKLQNRINVELSEKGLPSFSEIQNIHKTAYQNVLNNHEWITNNNGHLSDTVSSYINNSNYLGLANKTEANEHIKNNPATSTSKTTQHKNAPSDVLRYPLESDEERIPYMEIKGFKYQSDAEDVLGNKGSSNDTERTATILLPLPGNLASGLSIQYEDYNSVFSKLVRAYNGSADNADTPGMTEQFKSFFNGLEEGVWEQGIAAGAMAGVFSAMMKDGAGTATSTAIDETLKYVRVQAGIAINPMSQASYVGANIRTHSFEFNMVPRSAKEALECKKIIEMLQYCSLGEKRKEIGGILMNFPSIWNVSFKNWNGVPINGMLEIPDAFLTEVNVTYSPTRAGFTVTRDNDPFAYVLTVTFKEAQNLVRDDLSYIRQGGDLLSDIHPQTPQKVAPDAVNFDDILQEGTVTASTDNNNPGATPVTPVKKSPTAEVIRQAATITGKAQQTTKNATAAAVVIPAVKATETLSKAKQVLGAVTVMQAVTIKRAAEIAVDANNALKGGRN